jgi:hypothetical protein
MTGTCPDLLAALKLRERDLALELGTVRARLSELQDIIELIEQPQRRRRRRTEPAEPPNPPLHVTGANHQPPDDDELPLQSNAPGA